MALGAKGDGCSCSHPPACVRRGFMAKKALLFTLARLIIGTIKIFIRS